MRIVAARRTGDTSWQPLVKAKDEECPQQKTKKHLKKKKNGWEFGI